MHNLYVKFIVCLQYIVYDYTICKCQYFVDRTYIAIAKQRCTVIFSSDARGCPPKQGKKVYRQLAFILIYYRYNQD